MSDEKPKEKKEKEPPIDWGALLGDDLICNDAKPRDRDYYRWDPDAARWQPITCLDNLIVDLFLQVRGSPPTTKELANVALALGATQRIKGLKSPCAIDWEARTTKTLDGAVFVKNGVAMQKADGSIKLLPYTNQVFSLYRLPYAYDPSATCPTIDAWLEDRLGGDQEQIRAFWQFTGSCLQPGNRYKNFMVWVGEGNTGKSSGLNLLRDILGEENTIACPAPYLNVPSVVVKVRGKLLCWSEEKSAISASCEETIKDWTSGGDVNYNPKFKTAFSEPASAKLVLSMNKVPRFSDTSHALSNRVIILNWSRPIAQDQALTVEEIRKRLRAELPGALNRSLAAKYEVEAAGRIVAPKGSIDLANEIRLDASAVIKWFHERCEFRPNARTRTDHAFEDFIGWCDENREHHISKRELTAQLRDIGSDINGTTVRVRVVRARDGKDKFTDAYAGLALLVPRPKGLIV